MTIAGEVLVASAAAAGAAALLALGRAPRLAGAIAAVGLVVAGLLAFALPVPATAAAGTQLVVESGYLRSVTAAFALTTLFGAVVAAAAAVPPPIVTRIVAVSLLGIAAAVVTLGAADPVVAGFAALGGAAAGMGLSTGAGMVEATVRELRTVVIATAAVLAGAALAPALMAPAAEVGGGALDAAAPLAPAAGAATLVVALGTGLRYGTIPFHLWVARAADAVHPAALALVLGWLPMLLGVAAGSTLFGRIAPLGAEAGVERLVVAGLATLTLLVGPFAAWIQEDLDHLVGYVAVATAGLVLLGLASGGADAWAAMRLWLVVHALGITALATWVALLHARYGTRRLPELDGWARRSPIAAVALVLAALTLIGLPGWLPFEARRDLAELVLGAPLGTLVSGASLVVVAPIVRILVVGLRRPAPLVAGGPAELDSLAVARGVWRPALGAVRAGMPAGARNLRAARTSAGAVTTAIRANAPLLASLALALGALACLAIANGGLGVAAAIAEPPPAVSDTAEPAPTG